MGVRLHSRVGAPVGATAVLVAMLAGCGHREADHPAAPSHVPSSAPVAVARCGSVTDADLANALGRTGLQEVSASPLRCVWADSGKPGNDYSVVFEWFRGSSLDRRRAELGGQSAPITVAGRPGLSWSGPASCEVAVDSGGMDFIAWIVLGHPDAAGCASLRQLAETSVTRTG